MMKNRWAASLTFEISSIDENCLVLCTVDMLGNAHKAILGDVEKALGGGLIISAGSGEVTAAGVIDDYGIPEALIRAKHSKLIFKGNEVKNLEAQMRPGERVLELGQGSYEKESGLVVLTNQRLFFFQKAAMFGERIEEFSLSAISSISLNKGMSGEVLTVHASGNNAEIKNLMPGRGSAIADAFNLQKSQSSGAVAPTAVASDVDPMAQLEKLAALRDKGIISDQDFEAKKAEILDRI
jgi:hypothetical protein